MPVTIKDAKELTKSDCQFTPCADERYSYCEYVSEYAGIRQKWAMYHSEPMHEQKKKTFEKNLEKHLKKAWKSFRKSCAGEFACEPDAKNAAGKWLKKHPKFQFSEFEILTFQRKTEKKRDGRRPVNHWFRSTQFPQILNTMKLSSSRNGKNSAGLSWQRMTQRCLQMNCSRITKHRVMLRGDFVF